jgi:hypothetical protein
MRTCTLFNCGCNAQVSGKVAGRQRGDNDYRELSDH